MRENIKAIKWCSCISLLFLLLAYAVTVNSEIHFIVIDSVWISNDFLITLFGGVFTSMLVVALCEIQKYLSKKASTEEYLFYQGLYLYQSLMQMKIIIKDYLNHCEWNISENLLDESVRMVHCEINAIQSVDYATFIHGDNSLMVAHARFRIEAIPKIQAILQSGIKLKLAINETIRDNLQEQLEQHTYSGNNKFITSDMMRVNRILNNELAMVSSSIALVNTYIVVLDNNCNNRFKWDAVKEKFKFSHCKVNTYS